MVETPQVQVESSLTLDDIYRLSVEQYHQMAAHGILTEDDHVELLEGLLVKKMTKNPPHIYATNIVRDLLQTMLPQGWFVNSQDPVITPDSEPEPDASVIRGHRRDYLQRKPGLGDAILVIEVADATLRQDRGVKKRAYAEAGIPVYWIINLNQRRIEVYTDPTGPVARPDYRQRQEYGVGDEVPVVIDGQAVGRIAVSEVLP